MKAETADRVRAYAKARGWVPNAAARALSFGRADTLGVVIAEEPSVFGAEPFYLNALAGLAHACSEANRGLLVRTCHNGTELEVLDAWARERRVDGVVLFDLSLDDPRPAFLRQRDLPFVLFGEYPESHACPTETESSVQAESELLARHFAHRRDRGLLFLAGPENLRQEVARARELKRMCEGYGLHVDSVWTEYRLEDAHTGIRDRFDPAHHTAVMASSDVLAVGAAAALAGFSEQAPVAVVSWDDSLLCRYAGTPISALNRDIYTTATVTADLLMATAYGAAQLGVPAPRFPAPTFEVRASSRFSVTGRR